MEVLWHIPLVRPITFLLSYWYCARNRLRELVWKKQEQELEKWALLPFAKSTLFPHPPLFLLKNFWTKKKELEDINFRNNPIKFQLPIVNRLGLEVFQRFCRLTVCYSRSLEFLGKIVLPRPKKAKNFVLVEAKLRPSYTIYMSFASLFC